MAVSSSKAGRPFQVADISFGNDPDRDLYDQFYRVCQGLTYFETIVLARSLKVDVRTVRRWQSGRYFPARRGTALLIMGWVGRGKPRKVITQAELAAGMF